MASRIDLNDILEQLQTVFQTANTTTASPIDLSSSMNARVQTIAKVHPEKIPLQASLFPFITCFITGKNTSDQTIGKSQANIKRKAVIDIEVICAVWNDKYASADEDPADKDIHYLMENAELVLRSSETLNASTLWQVPTRVSYFSSSLDETTHLRAGVMSLQATLFY